jgi:hypothetical protein
VQMRRTNSMCNLLLPWQAHLIVTSLRFLSTRRPLNISHSAGKVTLLLTSHTHITLTRPKPDPSPQVQSQVCAQAPALPGGERVDEAGEGGCRTHT